MEGPEARHLSSVLRKCAGDEIGFFDGQGKTGRARLERVSAEKVETTQESLPALAVRL